MTDFEWEVYRSMSSEGRCRVWIVKAMDMQEYAGLMTPADQKLLRKILDGMVGEAQG